jgi:ornithine cyclodeaminase
MVRPGAHVTTLGPDQPGKCEVDAGLLRKALVVVDDRDLALSMGAVGGAGLGADAIDASLGEVLAGRHPGRTSPEQVTVLGAVGLPWQDLVAAWHAYTRAKAASAGSRVALLGA